MDNCSEDGPWQVPAASQLPNTDNPSGSATATSSSNLPNDYSEIVPIFYEDDYLRAYDRATLSEFTARYDPADSEHPPRQPFPFQFPLPQIGRITMADRFPKIEDLGLGKPDSERLYLKDSFLLVEEEPTPTASGQVSFLERERAALGEDAEQFTTSQDHTTASGTLQGDDVDLLGEDDDFVEPQHAAPTNQQDLDFESSYPAIDTQNEVGKHEMLERSCS